MKNTQETQGETNQVLLDGIQAAEDAKYLQAFTREKIEQLLKEIRKRQNEKGIVAILNAEFHEKCKLLNVGNEKIEDSELSNDTRMRNAIISVIWSLNWGGLAVEFGEEELIDELKKLNVGECKYIKDTREKRPTYIVIIRESEYVFTLAPYKCRFILSSDYELSM